MKRKRCIAHVVPGVLGKLGSAGAGRAEAGFALPLALIVAFLITLLGIALFEVGRLDGVGSVRDLQDVQAKGAAEMGLARANTVASSQIVPWYDVTYGGSNLTFASSSDPVYSGHQVAVLFTDEPVGGESNATYSVVIEDLTGHPPTSQQYRIHAYGTSGTRTCHITLDSLALTFATFGWLTESESGIAFATGDVVDGWVWTNDVLTIFGKPVFLGQVNTAASGLDYWHGGPPADQPTFMEGINFNSNEIDIQSVIIGGHIPFIRDRALEPAGIYLPPNDGRPYNLVFNSDGTVTVEKQNADDTWEIVINEKQLSTTNGAIYIEDTVQVSGTLDGQITLGTPEGVDIEIVDDLVYAYPADPRLVYDEDFDSTDPLFDDQLGLVSGGDIVVTKAWNNSWTNIMIMANLVAAGGSFKNAHYLNFPEKNLDIFGGVAQYVRGSVGSKGGGSSKGFLKNYIFDDRYLEDPPPYYPTVGYGFFRWNIEP